MAAKLRKAMKARGLSARGIDTTPDVSDVSEAQKVLAANLKKAMADRRTSARGLSLAAGLSVDSVRNVISFRSKNTRTEAVQALAKAIGVSVDALTGREPLPPPTPPGAATVDPGTVRIPEIQWVPRPAEELPHAAAQLERREGRAWSLPADLIAERRIAPGGIVVIHAPEDLGEIRHGDRLLVDTSDKVASPPGEFLVWDKFGVGVGRCSMGRREGEAFIRLERGRGDASELRLGEDLELLGRVVARMAWM